MIIILWRYTSLVPHFIGVEFCGGVDFECGHGERFDAHPERLFIRVHPNLVDRLEREGWYQRKRGHSNADKIMTKDEFDKYIAKKDYKIN